MEISENRFYLNKTSHFLVDCLKGYGNEFILALNKPPKYAFGIYDVVAGDTNITKGRNIYILLNKTKKPNEYIKLINFLSNKEYFRGCYPFRVDLPNNNYLTYPSRQMLIIQIPKEFNNAYDKFLEGKYSEMYTKGQLNTIFRTGYKSEFTKILRKDKDALEYYIKKIKEEFGVNVDKKHVYNIEWELPLKRNEEIFNCKDEGRIFFDKKLDKTWDE